MKATGWLSNNISSVLLSVIIFLSLKLESKILEYCAVSSLSLMGRLKDFIAFKVQQKHSTFD
jgi:hypothetical protein